MRADAPDLSPVDERRSGDTFAAVVCPALRTALHEVSVEWAPQWAPGSEGESSINHVLMSLALRLDRVGDGSVVVYEDGGGQETLDHADLRLLAAIRRSLLERWHRGHLALDQDRVLALLHSIDLLAEEPVNGAAEDLELPLTEPEAFRLVAEVVHDLRSPLTSILFLSEALRNGQSGSLTGLQERQLGLIYSAALGLTGVTNDLMTIAQEQRCGPFDEADADVFSLHDTFEAVREMVAPVAEAKRIALRFGVNYSGHRLGYAGPLGRVLLNLTTNAIRFTPEGGSVEVLADPVATDTVEVSVRDTGRGIPPEEMAELFQPFKKSRGREDFFFAASGLGLSIVRRLLKNMDSELTIDSRVGRGTRFSFIVSLLTPR